MCACACACVFVCVGGKGGCGILILGILTHKRNREKDKLRYRLVFAAEVNLSHGADAITAQRFNLMQLVKV